jgi:lipid-binding SYLF domain-containing protein
MKMRSLRKTSDVGRFVIRTFFLFFMIGLSAPTASYSASAEQINIEVDAVLEIFCQEVNGGDAFLKKAAGVLVFPSVIKGGVFIGGEYGEGALSIEGNTLEYYSTAAASVGFQLGAQSKSVVLVFMNSTSLREFRNSDGWKAGVDGSVAVIEWGAGEDINTIDISDPVIGFVFNNKGLMYNLTLEGSKFTKIVR